MRGLRERLVTLRGVAWKALLRHAEALAYLVAGLPMALGGCSAAGRSVGCRLPNISTAITPGHIGGCRWGH